MNFRTLRFKIFNSYFVSSISITFVLLVLGFFALLLLNTRDLSKKAKESVLVSILIKPDVTRPQVDSFYTAIVNKPYAMQVKVITPDDAMEMIKKDLGENIDEVLEYNPLPMTITVNLEEAYANSDSLQILESSLKQNDIVDQVYYNRSLVYQLDKNVRKIALSVAVLELLLLLMAIALINNTVRLLIYSKRFEIKTMQLVGATSWFIIKPFLTKAVLHGLISSLVSIAILIAGILYYQSSSEDVIQIFHLETVIVLVLFAGTGITVLSTYISVRSFLNSKTKDLYLL